MAKAATIATGFNCSITPKLAIKPMIPIQREILNEGRKSVFAQLSNAKARLIKP